MIRQMAQNPALKPARFDMLSPRVQVYGETGIVTYTRLMTYDEAGKPRWTTFNETRVFVKRDGQWKMAHFHRAFAQKGRDRHRHVKHGFQILGRMFRRRFGRAVSVQQRRRGALGGTVAEIGQINIV